MSEHSGDPNEPLCVRDALAQINRWIDDVNVLINDLRDDMSALFRMLL